MLVLIIAIILIVSAYLFFRKPSESWIPYMELPYGNWKTAPEPPVFYPLPRYREPYMFPMRFKTSYPVKHCATLD